MNQLYEEKKICSEFIMLSKINSHESLLLIANNMDSDSHKASVCV